MGDDLDVQSSRVVVAILDLDTALDTDTDTAPDTASDTALRSARTASAEGHEVVYLGRSDPQATAWAVRAEDAATALVVADDASAQQLREALDAMGLHEVQVSRVASR
ncbi:MULTISPECIES: hypothetical protein [unclassified Aeromicrobium]|uniref:hypothetical protein n=1 Tax=unclassified Aeromicrobium TaxID=2633570 RepID=UPI0006F6FD54|nr:MULTISPECIES: hypothetical protein [unclassified Aeromicrobium]KQP27375.1 hypothetical protein ASF38_06430 [Aeromicrobium sp. Leaf272]KQP74889.1 hypothetical protein ASF37_16380 [Aeromicrobium sp. Leaf289]